MSFPAETKVTELRARFEGREAIYVEQGAMRVRVSDMLGRRQTRHNGES